MACLVDPEPNVSKGGDKKANLGHGPCTTTGFAVPTFSLFLVDSEAKSGEQNGYTFVK